jgi:hypothetical protein
MTLYERIAATPDGLRHLAIARLTTNLDEEMCTALDDAGLMPDDVYRKLTRRQRRALRKISGTTDALAAFLFECGRELAVELVPAGRPRLDVLTRREGAAGADERHA